MGINIADNFAYNGKKPMDNRTEYTTLAAMKAVVDANINEGCICYNKEDGKYYTFKSTNTVDATTGKWREFETGGGGQTYNDFTGATASTAGAHGLVPAPSAGDEDKVLFGSGLWGNLPSVDLSGLSPEAFQFSMTEKVVGQWIDGKPLYQKTWTYPDGLILNKEAWNNTNIDVTSVNMDKLISLTMGGISGDTPVPYCTYGIGSDAMTNKVALYTPSAGRTYHITIQYTKTTDSPLPSGVKFAGVTDTGEVIYKKWVTTGDAVPSGGTLLYRQALLNGKDIIYYTT